MNKSVNEILKVIKKVSKKSAVIIGDIILDEYVYGIVEKVSTGIQIPIIEKKSVDYRLGGAANVAANVAGLCRNVTLVGRCADDDAGIIVKKLCSSNHVNLVDFETEKTTVKQRIYIDNQQVSRIDSIAHTETVKDELMSTLLSQTVDFVIIADYLYGAISQEAVDITSSFCEKKGIPIFLTSRNLNQFEINDYPIVVANMSEWNQWKKSCRYEKAIITKGENGICYKFGKEIVERKANKKYPINVSGAGDTVLATISSFYGEENISVDDILLIGNLAGELAVENELTYVLSNHDLVDALFKQWTQEDCINKIVDISLAKDVVKAWKQNGEKIVFTNGCYDLLHLGHIKSFLYAKKYGDKLVVAVNSDSSIRRLKGNGRPINNYDERINTLAYLSMIDLVIGFDEDTAINVIKAIEPDVYIKGEEYKHKKLLEAEYVKKVEYVPMIEGISTTQLIKKISEAVKIDE